MILNRHMRRGAECKSLREKISKGTAIVQFALCLPIIITIVMLTLDVATYIRADMVAQNAAASAARYYATHGTSSDAQIKSYALENIASYGSRASVTVTSGAELNDNFTMRVYNSGTWKTANAKSVSKPKTVTVKINVKYITPSSVFQFIPAMNQVSKSSTAEAVTSEAKSR